MENTIQKLVVGTEQQRADRVGSSECITGETALKATKRGWRQRNKNGSGALEKEMPEAVINTTPGKVVPPRYRFQNNLNQSLKVRIGEESKLNSSAAFNMTQLSEAELLKPQNSLNSS